MSEITVTRCEGCGRTIEEKNPRQWLRMTLEIHGHSDKTTADLCSMNCLARYAQNNSHGEPA